MTENENNFDSLESIIKVEPEEFQATNRGSDFSQSADDVLRLKANIFSDPIVLLGRLNFETTCLGTSNLFRRQKKVCQSEKVDTHSRKGNEGLNWNDPHTCCFCQKVFSNRRNLKMHLERVHCKSTKLYCGLCPKFYFSKGTIAQHMRAFHGKKRFACNVCDYKTADKSHFEDHKRTHGAKVTCPVCNKTVASLKSHMTTHRPKVPCPICQKMIVERHTKSHMKTHGENPRDAVKFSRAAKN